MISWMPPAALGLFTGEADSTFWMPPQGSDFAVGVDGLFDFILYLSIFFFVVMMYFMLYWAVKYRAKPGEVQRTHPMAHNFKLEFLWSAIPTVLLIVIFAWGFQDFTALSATPSESVDVRVVGQQWSWTMQYPKLNKECANKLVLPVDEPFTVTMSSEDVLHSLFIPSMRVKRDALPYRYTGFTVTPTLTGVFPLFCTEYCGNQHSNMIGTVEVLSRPDFDAWVESKDCPGIDPDAPDYGPRLFAKLGCTTCHSVEKGGARIIGPPLWNLFGREESISSPEATTVTVDENYIRESIEYPEKQIVKGYEGQNMPAFRGRVDEKGLAALIDYIKTLSDNPPTANDNGAGSEEGSK